MRVIGGEYRSRRLKTLPGLALRPTPDRLREALFNVLAARISGATFMDLYAGCGAVGIEALSRGAALAIFIEKHSGAARIIQENLASLGLTGRARVFRAGAASRLTGFEPGIVFLDPPYDQEREYETVLARLGEKAPPLVVVQHTVRLAIKEAYGRLHRTRVLRQGDNALSFFEPRPPAD